MNTAGIPHRAQELLNRVLNVRGYRPALTALFVSACAHLFSTQFFQPRKPLIIFIYLLSIIFSAWCGYGPGILVTLVAVSYVSYIFSSQFHIDWLVLGILTLLSVLISRVSNTRRQAEMQLRNANADLDRRVRQKTAELDEANAALSHQVAELETLYGDLSVGVCFLDRELRYVRVNEKLALLNGRPVHEHLGRTLSEVLPPAVAEAVEPIYRRILESGGSITDLEFQTRMPANPYADGFVTIGCSPVRTSNGTIIGVQVIVQDITPRKQAEIELARAHANLQRSEAEFRTMANAIPQLCWMADSSGSMFWLNDRWYQYTGKGPGPTPEIEWQNAIHPEHLLEMSGRWRDAVVAAEPFEMVLSLRGAAGIFHPFLTRALPLRTPDGQVLRWFGTSTDITERKSIEDALRRSNEALRRANEDLAQFAYIAAHDLQEPLRTVVSFSQLADRAMEGSAWTDARSHLDLVVSAGRRMSQLITDVLAYSRATTDREQVVEAVDLNDVLLSVLSSLQGLIRETDARIIHGRLPLVLGDSGRLSQVLLNLIGNSLKYRNPAVRPEVEVLAELNDSKWVFSVRDNGQGFSQAYAERIFGIFKRLHGREVPGSGIGLAISKTIVERHGGRIWAESGEGRGATFYFTLPAGAPETARRAAI